MNQTAPIHIFHIRRLGDRSLLLHPFGKEVRLTDNQRPVVGVFGADPQMDVVNQFRELLYRQIDSEIRSWLTEMRFIPRFLVSALVFLLVYFILSLAIRDPIPMVVQLSGAAVAAVAFFLWLGRRDELSSRAVEKRAAVRATVDGISFTWSPVLEAFEDLIVQYQGQTDLILAELLAEIRRTASADSEGLCPALIEALQARYDDVTLQKLERRFAASHDAVPFEALVQWGRSFKADPGLLALYLGLKT